MSVSKLAAISAALLLALGLPLVAGAKEESKIQVLLSLDSSPSNGKGKGRSDGKMQSTFTESQATFQVKLRQLVPDGLYQVRARDSEATDPASGEMIAEFTAGSNGQANLKIDLLQSGDPMSPPVDPRGKLISIYDPVQGVDVMSGWFYGDAADDTPHSKVKEQTALEPADEATEGTVSARYTMGPNGKGGLNLHLQNAAPDTTYEIHLEGAVNPVETLTTNSGGTAKLSLRTQPGKGKSKGNGRVKAHNKKGQLTFDPRRKLIEVKEGDVVVFSGPMLAQIPSLNDCGVGMETVTPMLLDPGQTVGAGEVTTGVDESCDPIFGVAVYDLPVGDYTLLVDGVEVGMGTPLAVADDGLGGTFGELRFDANPEASDPDELPLDFAAGSGSLVEVVQGDAILGYTTFLEVTLP